ncbi:glycosyltransferase family 4 protein [Micromonospora sp. NPDC049679]|uniref:glycosyltransferase family 4 protein n=1 Tax=Micromonospora sp. NPDC049679 TaxID=3155920 RepID=UPI0033ED2D92
MQDIPSTPTGQRPLRIAMIVPPYYELPPPSYGGVEQVCAALVDALVARGNDVTLFGAGSRTGTSATFVSTVKDTQSDRLGQSLPELVHLARVDRLIEEDSFDVVHDHTMVGPLAAAQRRVPTVVTIHNSPTGELGEYLRHIDRAVALVAISYSQRRVGAGLPWAATVYNGLAAEVQPKPRPTPEGPALWLARFAADKGPDLAIKACRAAGVPLVLAGKASEPVEKRYLDEVIRPMLGPDVELLVSPSRERCWELLAQARCLLMPIRWEEPFGMVLLEAMASGTPIVALAHGAVPEVVRHGETGLVCQRPEELPEAIERVAGMDPRACAEHVRTHFSPDIMARRYERIYHRWRTTVPRMRTDQELQPARAELAVERAR